MPNVLLKDIAREAGVSVTTVSFVLNRQGKEKRISDEVIRKVEQVIQEKNYRPNAFAKGLRTGKTGTIALIVEDIGNFFFGNVAKTIESIAYRKGYKVLFASTDFNETKATELLETLKKQYVDGMIIAPTTGMKPAIQQLVEQQQPFVLFDRYFPDLDTNYVVLDNFQGAYDITQQMVEKGYRKIGLVTILSEMTAITERESGYRKGLTDHGLFPDERHILRLPVDAVMPDNTGELTAFFGANELDALLFTTNYLGIFGLECLQHLGINIPDGVGVASFDDHDLFRLHQPSICVVAQPIEELAGRAIDLLLQILSEDEQLENVKIRVPAQVIMRNSLTVIKR